MFPAEILPRKTSFLIRDILPDSVNEDSINRSPHSDSRSPERTPPISRASSLELLHAIRPTAWDARFLTGLNHDGDHGAARHSVAQIGRVVHSCGSLCCVVCSSGWPATSLNSDVLNHHSSRVLGGNLGSAPTLVTPASLSWNCLGSNSLFASSGHDRNREELSESPLSSQLSLSSEINEKPNHRDSTPTPINPSHVPSAVNSASSGSSAQTRKVRRNRTVFTELQLMGLERRFDSQKYLSTPDRAELARALGLTQLQVKTWYQNRRMKWKKQVMQGGCTVPPTKPKGRPKKNSIPSMSECELNNLNNPIKPAFLRVVSATGDKPMEFVPTTVPCPFPITDNII